MQFDHFLAWTLTKYGHVTCLMLHICPFKYLKSCCPLNFRKSHQILCIPNGSYKEDNMKKGRICPTCEVGLNCMNIVISLLLTNCFEKSFIIKSQSYTGKEVKKLHHM